MVRGGRLTPSGQDALHLPEIPPNERAPQIVFTDADKSEYPTPEPCLLIFIMGEVAKL